MQINWISFSALLSIYFGFAALLGIWIFHAKKNGNLRFQAIPLIIAALMIVLSIWVIPYNIAFKLFLLITCLVAMSITAFRLNQFSFHPDWAWLYSAFSMGLIMIWSITQGQAVLAFSMSFLAAIACLFALARGRQALL